MPSHSYQFVPDRYFRKVYHSPSEEEHRFRVFASSLAEARVRNAQNVAAGGEHVFGVTRFSDETPEEFNRRYKGRKGHGRGVVSGAEVRRPLAYTSALMGREGQEGGSVEVSRPSQVDWVAAGATTSIGNQGQCGVRASVGSCRKFGKWCPHFSAGGFQAKCFPFFLPPSLPPSLPLAFFALIN